MVHWSLLVGAFLAGGILGILMACILFSKRE